MPEAIAGDSAVFPAADYGNPDPEWLKIDWRQHLHRIELPGAEVNYVEIGEGEPILFVHGIAGCWRNWLENLPHFGRTHRAIALDLPGFGNSPMPSWPIDMPSYGRLIHDFCEKLGIDRVAALVGNSMGGFASTEAVIEQPSRFERLVLVSAAGISFAETRGRETTAFVRLVEAAAVVLLGHPSVHFLSRRRSRQVGFGSLVNYPDRLRPELLWEQIEPSIRAPGFAAAARSIVGYDSRDRLPEIEIPTTVVWGLKDRIVPVEAAIGYHRLIADSRLEIFERTGHLPQLERPSRFNALIDEFLD
ncbi:MAG TPA: alpha/beta fold hydrolase [Solirubrobacterales bacterium]|nr:alpha/beta fold hydrolase [Solirubrobacterales bacterium]